MTTLTGESSSMGQIWWVNQGQTYRAERDGGYVWAPQRAQNGAAYGHHEAVSHVRAGDRIVHYANGAIRAIGIATTDGGEASRPDELPQEQWGRSGFRAQVDYHELGRPILLNDLDERVRIDEGGPFTASGAVKQGYMFELPARAVQLLDSDFADRLPVALSRPNSTGRVVAIYVGKSSEPNLAFSLPDGKWGWKVSQPDYSRIQTGDRIAFAVGDSGGSPRVKADEFVQHRLHRLVLGRITSEVSRELAPYWPDENDDVSYPFRLTFNDVEERGDVALADLDDEFGGPIAEAFRRSANGQGRGIVVDISPSRQSDAHAPSSSGGDPPPAPFGEVVKDFTDAIRDTNLRYSEELIRLFVTSLATKRFLILTGLSGSGKTRLAQTFGEWLGSEQFLIVPVRPDWTSPDALLGYENGLSEPDDAGLAWHVPATLRFILQAAHDPSRPYLLVLDEMNLAHVERYFADILSGMESGAPVVPNLRFTGSDWRVSDKAVPLLALPDNLFVVGTVNVDETTYMFSPKVLDRANTIEFRVETDQLGTGASGDAIAIRPAKGAIRRGLLRSAGLPAAAVAYEHQVAGWLRQLHALLTEFDREFGHRVFQEALRFSNLLAQAGEPDPMKALDAQVLQKILPKFHGSIREISDPLDALGAWAFHGPASDIPEDFSAADPPTGEAALPASFDKAHRMARRLRANHFVSFAE